MTCQWTTGSPGRKKQARHWSTLFSLKNQTCIMIDTPLHVLCHLQRWSKETQTKTDSAFKSLSQLLIPKISYIKTYMKAKHRDIQTKRNAQNLFYKKQKKQTNKQYLKCIYIYIYKLLFGSTAILLLLMPPGLPDQSLISLDLCSAVSVGRIRNTVKISISYTQPAKHSKNNSLRSE